MHNYVAAQGSPHWEEMHPSLQGEGGQGSRQGRCRAPGKSLGRRLGTRAKAQGLRAPVQEETPLLSEMPSQAKPSLFREGAVS